MFCCEQTKQDETGRICSTHGAENKFVLDIVRKHERKITLVTFKYKLEDNIKKDLE
jgi:hypothetical protein